MRLLLDTHAFLWWVDGAAMLSRRARTTIGNPRNECLLSIVSCWEMAIKQSLNKLKLRSPLTQFIPDQLAANGFSQLAIDLTHVTRVAALRFHHRDPFDRLLAAQAIEEDLTIVSADPVFGKYDVRRVW